jgi:phage terminase large subunit-like protein
MTHDDWKDKALQIREALKGRPMEKRRSFFLSLPEDVRRKLLTSPYILGRDKQVEALTSDADTILILAGRGWGKGFTAAHWLLDRIESGHTATGVVAQRAADVRDDIVEPAEENAGIVEFAEKRELKPDYKRSESRVEIKAPHGTARIQTYSGDKPNQLRGFSGSAAWIDELAKMRYADEVWDQINLTLREGSGIGGSQLIITTTPRPLPVIQDLVDDPDVHVIRGSSWENEENLDGRMIRHLNKLEGTDLGRQEIDAEVLEQSGELWTRDDIGRRSLPPEMEFDRIVVGLDPSVSKSEGDEAGIVVVGKSGGTGYVLEDLSGQYTPREWAALTVAAYQGDIENARPWLDHPYSGDVKEALNSPYPWRPADTIKAERNQGGGLVENQLNTFGSQAAINSTHTIQNKSARAEPIHTLYQIGDIVHVGQFPELEDQMTAFLQDEDSPDRVDALVYACSELFDVSDSPRDAFDTILSM